MTAKGAFDHQIGGVSANCRDKTLPIGVHSTISGAFYTGEGGAFDHQIGGVSASTDKAL